MRTELAAIDRLLARGERVALVSVIACRGSTYRRPGAHMLLCDSGELVGAISGGCLEDDLLEIGRQVLADGQARTRTYNTAADDDLVWGLGLGCNGVVECLIEPAPLPAACAGPLRGLLEQGAPCAVATVLADPGRRLLVTAEGPVAGSLGDAALDKQVAADAAQMMGRRVAGTLVYGGGGQVDGLYGRPSRPGAEAGLGEVRVYIEPVLPQPRLVLFGAGHDVPPVVALAEQAGWQVTVVDSRKAMLTPERLPGAHLLIHAHPEEAVGAAQVSPDDFCLLMTHSYNRDVEVLAALAAAPPGYVGVIGPRERMRALLSSLADRGKQAPPALLNALAGPIGIDIGGETPAEIALAIVAELQAVRYGRAGGRLRQLREPMHQRLHGDDAR